MRKKLLLLIACGGFIISLNAQQQQKKNHQFQSINNLILVNGKEGATGAIQSINGLKQNGWFAGIGLGLDYYQYRSVPFFADIRYEYGKKKSKPFVYGDLGINFSWVQDQFKETPSIWNGNRINDFKNGIYTDIGIGLSNQFKNGNALIISLGYSKKEIGEKIVYDDWMMPGKIQIENNKYRFNRILFKLGLSF